MKCITWNVRGPCNPSRRGVVGCYLRECGGQHDTSAGDPTGQSKPANMVLPWLGERRVACLPDRHRPIRWSPFSLKGDRLCSRRAIRQAEWRGRDLVAACLTDRADGCQFVFALAYGPLIFTSWGELWEDMLQMCETFPSHPVLIGGDFNMTLAVEDRTNGMGGRDPGSVQLWDMLF